jgi:U2-associated protein SR140
MPDSSKMKEDSSTSNKPTLPSKKSVFERQKEEAEAKKQREEAETAAVLQDFVKSFDDDSNSIRGPDQRFPDRGYGPAFAARGSGGAKRHFAPSKVLKSGPGSLGPAPPSRIRPGEPQKSRTRDRGIPGVDESAVADAKAAFQESDDENDGQSAEDRAAPKPTLQLSSLPPGTSLLVIKALLPYNLSVDSVRIVPQKHDSSATAKRSLTAIVTLAKETPSSEIDVAVNALQNRYLGLGFRLYISRHLSSSLLSTGVATLSSSTSETNPFGAKPIFTGSAHPLNRAPPPNTGFAPPTQFGGISQPQYGRNNGTAPLQVPVVPPSDMKQVKLIHKTLEAILTHGPEFEALLMSRSSVQKDERWAWLWDARSIGGIWYRWKLWKTLSGELDGISGRPQTVFDGEVQWRAPENGLKFEFTTDFEHFVGHQDYDSSDEENLDEDMNQKPADEEEESAQYLNPIHKAKFTHLLARLPTTTARLRKGDVARITAFAISHSGRGSDEVVQMLIDNVERPFALSSARRDQAMDEGQSDFSEMEDKEKEKEDPSSAKLIALFLISDLLSSSSTSGVRHAWRYRQLFETSLAARTLFKRLGCLERELSWGRLRAEKWRRAVTQVLELWEGWCVFTTEAQEQFAKEFIESAEGKNEEIHVETDNKQKLQQEKKKNIWKSVEATEAQTLTGQSLSVNPALTEIRANPTPIEEPGHWGEDTHMEDVDGEPMLEGEFIEDPMDEDLDGEPMVDSSDEEIEAKDKTIIEPTYVEETAAIPETKVSSSFLEKPSNPASEARRRRPRAVDMFVDSEEE